MSENVLRVENVTMQFGGVVAVDNMNLEVNQDEIVSLIGPNGAGKTTAFNVITGVYAPTNGSVYFRGNKIIENHPQGKMKKLYKGEHAGDYKRVLQPTPDKVTKLGIAVPSRTSVCGSPRLSLKTSSSPSIAASTLACSLPPSV